MHLQPALQQVGQSVALQVHGSVEVARFMDGRAEGVEGISVEAHFAASKNAG